METSLTGSWRHSQPAHRPHNKRLLIKHVPCDLPCCWLPIESGAWFAVLAEKHSDSRECIIARTYQPQIDDTRALEKIQSNLLVIFGFASLGLVCICTYRMAVLLPSPALCGTKYMPAP